MAYLRCIILAVLGFAAGFALSIPVRLDNMRLTRQLEEIDRQSVTLQAEALARSENEISRYRAKAAESRKQAASYLARLKAIRPSKSDCVATGRLLEPVAAETLVRVDGEPGQVSTGESGLSHEDTIYSVLSDALDGLHERQSSRK